MNAVFGALVHCAAAEPHATFLRIGVIDGRQEVAYETAVLGRLRCGYRVLQLRGGLGTRIELAYLFVRISLGSVPGHAAWHSRRAQEVKLREQSDSLLVMNKRVQELEKMADPNNLLSPDVLVFNGFTEIDSRILFPYSNTMEHLAEDSPPVHVTLPASGKNEGAPTKLWLGGVWKRAELEAMSDEELREASALHRMARADGMLIDALVGQSRDPGLRDRALITLAAEETMPKEAAKAHLTKFPNSQFVWPHDDGTVAAVHCWGALYDDSFRNAFECSEVNPDPSAFPRGKIDDFRRSMRNLFGPAADQ
eukprot:3912751-Prymnesium_polylepis.1